MGGREGYCSYEVGESACAVCAREYNDNGVLAIIVVVVVASVIFICIVINVVVHRCRSTSSHAPPQPQQSQFVSVPQHSPQQIQMVAVPQQQQYVNNHAAVSPPQSQFQYAA